jgi:hypothetical protein
MVVLRVSDELSSLDDALQPVLPVPGEGATVARFRALWDFGSRSPSFGRIAEAHHDAIAILSEAGRSAVTPGLYAVWAAGGPQPVRLSRRGDGWRLHGTKQWCSAASLASHALVTAQADDDSGTLVLVDLTRDGVVLGEPDWVSPAMTAVDTRSVHFELTVTDDDIVGVDDWYLQRPGFWHGAIGVAACWAGCAEGIVSRVIPQWRRDPHALAHLGAIDASLWGLRAAIEQAAREIDADPVGTAEARRRRALRVRHLVDASAADITQRLMRALGPAPLAHAPDVHRHIAELDLYRRQSHAERDLEVLGNLSTAPSTSDPCGIVTTAGDQRTDGRKFSPLEG